MPEPSYSIAVICEGPADWRVVCGLADRVLVDRIAWMDGQLDTLRGWRGWGKADCFLSWTEVSGRAKELRVHAHGHFNGEPGFPDAHMTRLALLLLRHSNCPLSEADAIVLSRDTDGSRTEGIAQALSTHPPRKPVVVALAHPKIEAWLCAGFEPAGVVENDRLRDVCGEIGFDPRTGAQALVASGHGSSGQEAKRSAKRVLGLLTEGNRAREDQCWGTTALTLLHARGREIGLHSFLEDVENKLVSLLDGSRSPPGEEP